MSHLETNFQICEHYEKDELFCQNCKSYICFNCKANSHTDHQIDNILENIHFFSKKFHSCLKKSKKISTTDNFKLNLKNIFEEKNVEIQENFYQYLHFNEYSKIYHDNVFNLEELEKYNVKDNYENSTQIFIENYKRNIQKLDKIEENLYNLELLENNVLKFLSELPKNKLIDEDVNKY